MMLGTGVRGMQSRTETGCDSTCDLENTTILLFSGPCQAEILVELWALILTPRVWLRNLCSNQGCLFLFAASGHASSTALRLGTLTTDGERRPQVRFWQVPGTGPTPELWLPQKAGTPCRGGQVALITY